ncbi:MAG: AraC family transcriptional regulator [Chloroflexota bacterium]|jgi:AraC-like DNA-binding protein
MTYQESNFEKFVTLLERQTPEEGPNYSNYAGFGSYKASTTHDMIPSVDVPAIWLVAQGKKHCYVGDQKYEYGAGKVLVTFYPMAMTSEIVEASPEKPLLVAGVLMDLGRMAEILMQMDRVEGAGVKPETIDPSGIFSMPLSDDLLDPFIRLLRIVDNPRDVAILGDSIVDEIYYRLLCERGDELRFLLQQRGEIQRISKTVDYIHQNLDQPVSVEQLANMAHMAQSTFYENFRNVMHMSPLQYAKSVKLDKAQALIKAGKKANEAGYLVGYNSPAQFSREYKRHFGYPPSATLAAVA